MRKCEQCDGEVVQVRIVGDGSYVNTALYIGDRMIEGVIECSWHLRTGGFATATVTIENVAVDAAAKAVVQRIERA